MHQQPCSAIGITNGHIVLDTRLSVIRSEIDHIQAGLMALTSPAMKSARAFIRARAKRNDLLEPDLFSDPA